MADINLGVGGANSAVAGGYNIDNSLKVEQDNTEYLTRTVLSTGNRKTGTISMWIKRTEVGVLHYIFEMGGTDNNTDRLHCRFNSTDTLNLATGSVNWRITNRVFRDTSAWYHLVVAVDTTQATASNRVKIYINGVEETSFSTSNNPSQNDNTGLAYQQQVIAYSAIDATGSLSGYLTDVYVIDGQQLAASDFGEFDEDTGIWKPKAYTGSYGNNGFYLDFENSASLGADGSGNGNNFTLNNITSADQATDTPTNNFAILNPLFKYPSSQVISEGNTEVTRTSGAGLNKTFLVTMPVYSGKWYAEFEPAASSNYVVGIMPDSTAASVAMDANYLGNSAYAESIGYYSATGQKIVAPSGGSAYGDTWTTGDTIGIALDMDNNYVYFSKNGTWQNSGDPTSGSSGTGGIALTNTTDGHLIGFSYDSGGNMYCNFGGYTVSSLASAASDANGYGTFEYAPPSGYYALCTKNLAEFG
jgi:hypothetical protein